MDQRATKTLNNEICECRHLPKDHDRAPLRDWKGCWLCSCPMYIDKDEYDAMGPKHQRLNLILNVLIIILILLFFLRLFGIF